MPRPTREDGYELWLRYRCVADDARLEQYRQALQSCFVLGASATTGLIRDEQTGQAIEVEVWAVPRAEFGSFVAGIPAPLGIGKVELHDGRWLPGFICESYAIETAQDITGLGGWRNYLAQC